MKLSKNKVLALALAVCLIATLSFGSLAWFTDDDSVTNDFMVAGSDDKDPDEIFSVDVWEDKDGDGQPDDDLPEDGEEGLVYKDILPGDVWDKVAHVHNTGSYDQYIRVRITVSDAKAWQAIYQANMVPVTEFVNGLDLSEVYNNMVGAYLDEETDSFVYYLYYNDPLAADDPETVGDESEDIVIFNQVVIPTHMTREQAAEFAGGFQVSVYADAVQTRNVCLDADDTNDAYEAFVTVGDEIPVNTVWVNDKAALAAAFADNTPYIVLDNEIEMRSNKLEATGDVELYLNDQTLTTANAETPYGVTVTGKLVISGNGNLVFGTAGAKADLDIKGGNVTAKRTDRIVDNSGNPIVIPPL